MGRRLPLEVYQGANETNQRRGQLKNSIGCGKSHNGGHCRFRGAEEAEDLEEVLGEEVLVVLEGH